MLVFYAYNNVFPCFNVFIIYLFFLQSKNMHNHAYVRSYLYYSNDFELHKIQVAQNRQERNSCVTWGSTCIMFYGRGSQPVGHMLTASVLCCMHSLALYNEEYLWQIKYLILSE
jgi:hypothetical protein